MGDSTISAIDRFFDRVDDFVDKTDRVLNRGKYLDKEPAAPRRRTSQPAEVIEAKGTPRRSAPSAKALKSPSTPKAKTSKPRFYIVESIYPEGTRYVVTDGGNARAECSTRELAEKLLGSLEAA